MPSGTHWEWRGFGTVSGPFVEAFESCPLRFPNGPSHDITTDEYLWVPGSSINVKLRTGGVEQGLKLKRLVDADGPLELWLEDPRELYPFERMNGTVLTSLAHAIGVTLAAPAAEPLTRERVLDALTIATPPCPVVTVRKKRQTRRHSEAVQVELAEILSVMFDAVEAPVARPLFSVAIENSRDIGGRSTAETLDAKREVESALLPRRLNVTDHLASVLRHVDERLL